MSLRFVTVGWIATLLVAGCAAMRGVVASAPRVQYAPPADRYVRSGLLDFETSTDAEFVDARDAATIDDPTTPGNHALRATDATVRLGALLRGRAFPGPWDLIGVRVRSAVAATVAATLGEPDVRRGESTATLAPGAWRTLWIETAALAATRPTSSPADALTLAIRGGGDVMIDDVALAQGRTVVAESVRDGVRFHVERSGLSWRATLGDRALATLPAAPFVDDGFGVVEANAARVVFANAAGATACVDRLGRVIRDGAIAPPATVADVSGAARLVRNAPGDRDNDGFDETRGCFTLRAGGDRFVVRLEPNGSDASVIVLDVDGLRANGVASVWVQGERIDAIARTTNADGSERAIIELPLRVERPVEVTVSVR